MKNSLTLLLTLAASAMLVLYLGCPVAPSGDDDDDNDDNGDDDTGDDDTGDDDTGDDDTGDDDTGDDDTGDDDSVDDQTIYEVQGGTYPEETEVFLADVIVTSPMSEAPPGFFAQEPEYTNNPEYSGIFVYVMDDAVAGVSEHIVPGNLIDLTATYTEYFDLSELTVYDAGDVSYVGTTNLTPVDVGTCDVGTGGSAMEEYESVLVAVTGVSVSSENPDGPDNDYGEFEVDGCLRVDDLFYDDEPVMGAAYSRIVGNMYYAYSNAKIEPRSAADCQM